MEAQDWIIEAADGEYRVRGTEAEAKNYQRQQFPGSTLTRG